MITSWTQTASANWGTVWHGSVVVLFRVVVGLFDIYIYYMYNIYIWLGAVGETTKSRPQSRLTISSLCSAMECPSCSPPFWEWRPRRPRHIRWRTSFFEPDTVALHFGGFNLFHDFQESCSGFLSKQFDVLVLLVFPQLWQPARSIKWSRSYRKWTSDMTIGMNQDLANITPSCKKRGT